MAKRKKLQDQNPPRRVEIRGQDHLLAYITPDEAALLKARGGSGEAGPMGIPAFDRGGGGPAGSAGTSGSGVGPDNASQDTEDSYGVASGSTSGFADAFAGYFGSTPLGMAVNAIGGFLDSTVGLEGHPSSGPGSGGGTGGDGYDSVSPFAKFYGYGGGSGNFGGQQNNCPPGYVYNENVGACVKDTGQSFNTSTNAGILQDLPAGAYARMGLLDMAPSELEDFASRYGITGYATPDAFTAQNQAFARQRATYPQFYESPPLMSDLRRLETGDIVAPTGVVPAPAPTPAVASSAAPAGTSGTSGAAGAFPESYVLNGTNFTPAGAMVATIAGLGNDNPVIAEANRILGPASGDVWERAFNTAALLPTPPRNATRGQYLEDLIQASRGYQGKAVPVRYQDDTGRTTGVHFFVPEGDN